MDTNLYQADSSIWAAKYSLPDLLEQLPSSLHKRAKRYQFEQDGYNFVLGRLLLKQGLKDLGLKLSLDDLQYEQSGKPFLKDVHFNISHSENLVVCALSAQGRLGIDVEKERPITLGNFKSFFTPNEWEDINTATKPLNKFYAYWTRKESIIKALGITLQHLHQISVDPLKDTFTANGHLWHLTELDLGEECFGVLCTESSIDILKVETMMEAF